MVYQRKYILDLLKETKMSGCKQANTPINPNKKLGNGEKGDLIDATQY